MKRILILYPYVTGYLMTCIERLVEDYNAEVVVVHWKLWNQTPLKFYTQKRIRMITKEDLTLKELEHQCVIFNPHIVITSGWQDKDYLPLNRLLKRNGSTTICAFDGHWTGTLRQIVGRIWFKFFQKPFFDYSWIPAHGLYQFELASRLGFSKQKILTGVYSGNQPLFYKAYEESLPQKTLEYPNAFFYVGRFSPEKGTVELYDAFKKLCEEGKNNGWKLVLIGTGPTETSMPPTSFIEVRPFIQPNELPSIVKECGCLVLPSHREQWGVVIHEFASAGVPLLVTQVAGAAPGFAKNGYNGYTFNPKKPSDLKDKLSLIVQLTPSQLLIMSHKSTQLSFQMTPDIWASTLINLPLTEPSKSLQ